MNLFILFIWISVGSCCIFVVWEDIELYSLRIGECIINNSEVMELVDGSLLKGFSGEIDGLIVYTVGKKTYARTAIVRGNREQMYGYFPAFGKLSEG